MWCIILYIIIVLNNGDRSSIHLIFLTWKVWSGLKPSQCPSAQPLCHSAPIVESGLPLRPATRKCASNIHPKSVWARFFHVFSGWWGQADQISRYFKTVFTNEVTLATLGQLGIGHRPKSFRAADCPETRSESAASAGDRWVSHFWCRKWFLKFLGALALRLKMIQVPSWSFTVLSTPAVAWSLTNKV